MRIQLRPNISIENPESLIIDYWGRERGARAYDSVRLSQDDSFSREQITLAIDASNSLGARIPFYNQEKVINPLMQKRVEIEEYLSSIPADLSIIDAFESIPWQKIKGLLDILNLKYLSLARKTKIMHKKRPLLIPILDSILETTYCGQLLKARVITFPEKNMLAIACIQELKKDIERNIDALLALQKSLNEKGYGKYDTSFTRLLDIIIWSNFFRQKAGQF